MAEKRKIQEAPYKKIGDSGFEAKIGPNQKLRFQGVDIDFENPDLKLLEEMAKRPGKLVRKIAPDEAKKSNSSGSSSTGK